MARRIIVAGGSSRRFAWRRLLGINLWELIQGRLDDGVTLNRLPGADPWRFEFSRMLLSGQSVVEGYSCSRKLSESKQQACVRAQTGLSERTEWCGAATRPTNHNCAYSLVFIGKNTILSPETISSNAS